MAHALTRGAAAGRQQQLSSDAEAICLKELRRARDGLEHGTATMRTARRFKAAVNFGAEASGNAEIAGLIRSIRERAEPIVLGKLEKAVQRRDSDSRLAGNASSEARYLVGAFGLTSDEIKAGQRMLDEAWSRRQRRANVAYDAYLRDAGAARHRQMLRDQAKLVINHRRIDAIEDTKYYTKKVLLSPILHISLLELGVFVVWGLSAQLWIPIGAPLGYLFVRYIIL